MADAPDAVTAIVIAVNRRIVEVLLDDGRIERCRLHGRYRDGALHGEGVVVGDRAVLGAPPPAPGSPRPLPLRAVVGIRPRATALRRHLTSRTDGRLHPDQTVAANVDLCLVVQAYRDPAFRAATADRLLVIARTSGVAPLLVLNKCEGATASDLEPFLAPYRAAGVEAFAVSAHSGEGIAGLRARLAGHLAVLLGPSGVGKSALTSVLSPASGPVVGAVSAARLRAGRGRHTTVQSRLYPLPDGGCIIDTAGIRSLGVAAGMAAEDAFPEIAALATGCRFSDCTHREDPGCAVRAALEQGRLAAPTYRGFLRVREDLAGRPVGRGFTHRGRRARPGPRGREDDDDL